MKTTVSIKNNILNSGLYFKATYFNIEYIGFTTQKPDLFSKKQNVEK